MADIAPVVADSLLGPFFTTAMRRQLEDSIRALRGNSYLKSLAATVEQYIIGELGFIDAPTHFVAGTCDTPTRPALALRMAANVSWPDVEVSVIEEVRHLSNIENSAQSTRRFAIRCTARLRLQTR